MPTLQDDTALVRQQIRQTDEEQSVHTTVTLCKRDQMFSTGSLMGHLIVKYTFTLV
jgi:hypothetical protein